MKQVFFEAVLTSYLFMKTLQFWDSSSVTKSLSKNSINGEKEDQARDILNNDFMLWIYPGLPHVSKVTIYCKDLASLGLS